MKFVVKNADLSRELGVLAGIVSKKPTLPVLSNVLIRANAGGLMLAATDLEVGLIGACAATVEEAGALTIPSAKLVEIVKAQSGSETTITLNGTQATFKSGKFTSRIQTLPASDFPNLPTQGGDKPIGLPREAFRIMVNQVRYATAEESTNYFLQGALLALPENGIVLSATDNPRMSRATGDRLGEEGESCIIPNRALDELKTLLGSGADDEFTFSRTKRHLFFDCDGRLLITRIIDGKMPSFERIIPKNNDHRATIDRQELLYSVKRAALLGEVLTLSVRPGLLEIKSVSQVGDADEQLIVGYDGPDITVRLRDSFVLDFLGAATGKDIVLALKDNNSAALFLDGGFMNVMMGMRV